MKRLSQFWNPESPRAKTISAILAIVLTLELLALVFVSIWRETRRERVPLRAHSVLIGTAIDPHFLNDLDYARTAAREFSMVEPENSMKWATIHPQRDLYDFDEGDRLVAFAHENGMVVRGHCLLWGAYLPHWLGAPEIRANLAPVVKDHIHKVVSHYRGRVFAWDVVNEAWDSNGNLVPTFWYNRPGMQAGPGTEYIELAFQWAHEADPMAKLFYNDMGGEEINPKSDAIYAMVKDFRHRGVPIDGVGFEAHLGLAGVNVESMRANIRRFAALGVEVHITELDVAIPKWTLFGSYHQAQVYKSIISACLAEPGCTAVQTWGFTDRHSWIPQYTNGLAGDALPFDGHYNPKPAFDAIEDALEGRS